MADAGQQFVTEVAVIDDLSVRGDFAKRSLKSDAVGTHVLQQPFPPVRTFFHDLVELCFRNSVAPAGLEKLRSADTTVAQNPGNSLRQFLATARCALINGNNGHDDASSNFSNDSAGVTHSLSVIDYRKISRTRVWVRRIYLQPNALIILQNQSCRLLALT